MDQSKALILEVEAILPTKLTSLCIGAYVQIDVKLLSPRLDAYTYTEAKLPFQCTSTNNR